jgi:hypothetical protein
MCRAYLVMQKAAGKLWIFSENIFLLSENTLSQRIRRAALLSGESARAFQYFTGIPGRIREL